MLYFQTIDEKRYIYLVSHLILQLAMFCLYALSDNVNKAEKLSVHLPCESDLSEN